MKFLTAIQFLVLAFVTIVVSDGAMAAPFTIGPSSVMPTPNPPVAGSCNNYNDQVLNHGAQLNGDHAGYCQFSIAQINLNGVAFDKFWQDISTGTKPPYDVSYSGPGPDGLCATAKNLKIEVSAQVQTSRLDWPNAATVGQACLIEWNLHSPAILVSTPNNATALSTVQRMVNYLNLPLRKSPTIQACVSQRNASRTQASAALAKKIKNFMRPWVMWAQSSLSADASGDECKLHCNVCSSGWAGTITATRTYPAISNNYTETDIFYVGGASSIANLIPAEWTTDGGPGSLNAYTWTLHAGVPGQCPLPPSGKAVCIQALTQGNTITFTEVNQPFNVDNAYEYTQNGIPQQPDSIELSNINGWTMTPKIQATSATATPPTTVEGKNPNMSCPHGPPGFALASYPCTQVWEWHLFKQP
jgi:hypothetical protein